MSNNINHNSDDPLDSFYQKKAQDYQIKPELSAFDAIMVKVAHTPIDDFYQKKAKTYQVEPKANAFKNIMSKSTIAQNSSSLLINSLKLGGIAIGLSIGAWLIFSPKSETKNIKIEKEVISIQEKSPIQEKIKPIIKEEKIITSEPKNTSNKENKIIPTIDKQIIQPSVSKENIEKKENIINDDVNIKAETPTITETTKEETNIAKETSVIKEESAREKLKNFFGKKDKKDSSIEIFNEKKKD